MPRIEIKKDKCKGCGLCVHFCPKLCIKMSEKLNARGVQYAEFALPDKCTGCKSCALVCPDVVIEVFK
ncbi:MAG: 4Fe-4S binding protein [Planctomycetes bacterium]|nr:4Fe-4S binding protein [Planctomycetota bacterium]